MGVLRLPEGKRLAVGSGIERHSLTSAFLRAHAR